MQTAILQVKKTHWEMIRLKFSEEEKDQLRAATVGESICPGAMLIDEKKVNSALLMKLKRLLGIKSPNTYP